MAAKATPPTMGRRKRLTVMGCRRDRVGYTAGVAVGVAAAVEEIETEARGVMLRGPGKTCHGDQRSRAESFFSAS